MNIKNILFSIVILLFANELHARKIYVVLNYSSKIDKPPLEGFLNKYQNLINIKKDEVFFMVFGYNTIYKHDQKYTYQKACFSTIGNWDEEIKTLYDIDNIYYDSQYKKNFNDKLTEKALNWEELSQNTSSKSFKKYENILIYFLTEKVIPPKVVVEQVSTLSDSRESFNLTVEHSNIEPITIEWQRKINNKEWENFVNLDEEENPSLNFVRTPSTSWFKVKLFEKGNCTYEDSTLVKIKSNKPNVELPYTFVPFGALIEKAKDEYFPVDVYHVSEDDEYYIFIKMNTYFEDFTVFIDGVYSTDSKSPQQIITDKTIIEKSGLKKTYTYKDWETCSDTREKLLQRWAPNLESRYEQDFSFWYPIKLPDDLPRGEILKIWLVPTGYKKENCVRGYFHLQDCSTQH